MKPVILAIDDDEPMLWLITKILKDFDVVSKPDGFEAMLWLSKGNYPDLILLDREMPNLSGSKFLRALRGSGLYKDIPVMVLSSWVDPEFAKDLENLNVRKFIEKPFDPAYLKEQVEFYMYPNSLHSA